MSRNVIVLDAESDADTGDWESRSSGGGEGVEQGEEGAARSMLGRAVDAWLSAPIDARPERSSKKVRATEEGGEFELCDEFEEFTILGGPGGPRRVLRGGRGGGSEALLLTADVGDKEDVDVDVDLETGGPSLGPKSAPVNAEETLAPVFVPARFRYPNVLIALSAENEGMVGDSERMSSPSSVFV